ncbi:hypothetical protein C0J45_10798 [Silurus meridionalis]|nr:hypothetical protein C0J45_10798 [Silurus meridionalis]
MKWDPIGTGTSLDSSGCLRVRHLLLQRPPRLPTRTTQLGILRRQYRQFQLSSLAAELTHFLEHLSSPSVPDNAFLPPHIVYHCSTTCDQNTQTSELDHRYDCTCFPDTTPQFSPSPTSWSPTDYTPTSPASSNQRAPVPPPVPGPSYSFIPPASAPPRTPHYTNKNA